MRRNKTIKLHRANSSDSPTEPRKKRKYTRSNKSFRFYTHDWGFKYECSATTPEQAIANFKEVCEISETDAPYEVFVLVSRLEVVSDIKTVKA